MEQAERAPGNITPEAIADLYHDICCKAYCSTEVPSRVTEMLKADPSSSATGALREIMIDRIRNLDQHGLLNHKPEVVQAVIDDLRQSYKKSKNLCRLRSRYRHDAGLKGDNTVPIGGTVSFEKAQLFRSLAALRKVTAASLAKHILLDWIDRHEKEITEAKANG